MGAINLPFDSQRRLINLSRRALVHSIHGVHGESEEVKDPYLLSSDYGSFVSLHKGTQLRGCVGTCVPTGPLYETVIEMTQAAVSQDCRFSPVIAGEIPHIRIELSVLFPLERVGNIQSLIIGAHGLHVSCGEKRGVLLPQVAKEYGWDMETFLGQVCLKADLAERAWKSEGVRISSFTALLIEEGQ